MVYDQAQSPRLGQRTPVESTYVQIVDVTPGNDIPDLPEASYPGQLIYRNDLGILQIWSYEEDTWVSVAGGIAGQATYVGPEEPTGTGFSIGDAWYDSDANYKLYVWNGTDWVPSAAGIQTFYEPGFGDPIIYDTVIDAETGEEIQVPRLQPIPGYTIGDIWYQTDDSNRQWWWNGTIWLDAHDPKISDVVETANHNAVEIGLINHSIVELGILATSTDNTADTADGRVSMSDYRPGNDDLNYVSTNPITLEEHETPRVNGSIWYVRTRPRRNLCTNPSFETNDLFWSSDPGTDYERHDHHTVPAGIWTLHVRADSTDGDPDVGGHWVGWGADTRVPCEDGQVFTASVYGELLTGVGTGVTLQLVWCDGTGAEIGVTTGPPHDLLLNAFDPATMNTTAEPRLKVTGVVPAGAVSFWVREVNPNPDCEWHTGAMLVEQEDDLGRYFDGDSFDAHWDGVPHNTTSYLEGDKIQEIWELRDNEWIRKYLTDGTLFFIDASKLIGQLDGSIITPGSLTTDKVKTTTVTASEAMTAGDIVNVWNDNGLFKARKASASLKYVAHGFLLASVTSGAQAMVYHVGVNNLQVGLAPGTQWLSTIAGKVTGRPPSSVGSVVQRIGFAPNNSTLNFEPMTPIWIT